jgi:hypothetical protein
MSIKDLEPLNPTSPFYPTFVPNGSEVSVLFTKVMTYSASKLSAGIVSQISVTQPMFLPLGANISFFTCQVLDQNGITVLSGSPAINISDVNYSSVTGNMTFDIGWKNLAQPERPNIICTVFYYL